MGLKKKHLRKIFEKTLFLHRTIARTQGNDIVLLPRNGVVTQKMEIDCVPSTLSLTEERYSDRLDYVRYRTAELVAESLKAKYTEQELSEMCVAEAGVNSGIFAEMINDFFPSCYCYLYDTFSGFSENDMIIEEENGYTGKAYLKDVDNSFKNAGAENLIAIVRNRLRNKDKAIIRRGYFPDTVEGEKNSKFCFVSLDMDIYKPMIEGLKFFWPRMVRGGVIFVHDYNNVEYKGVKEALAEAERLFGDIHCIPIPDKCGTMVLIK